MSVSNKKARVFSHAIGGVLSASFLTALILALYYVGAMATNDAGGPLFMVMVPILAVAIGGAATVVIYWPCALLGLWLVRKSILRTWMPPVICSCLFIAIFILWSIASTQPPNSMRDLAIPAGVGAFFSIGFVAYWLMFFAALLIMKRLQDGETHCRKCDQILKGLVEPRCPACGESI